MPGAHSLTANSTASSAVSRGTSPGQPRTLAALADSESPEGSYLSAMNEMSALRLSPMTEVVDNPSDVELARPAVPVLGRPPTLLRKRLVARLPVLPPPFTPLANVGE